MRQSPACQLISKLHKAYQSPDEGIFHNIRYEPTTTPHRCHASLLVRVGLEIISRQWACNQPNPPFIGASFLRSRLGDAFAEALWASHSHMNESADFVMYWWDRAAELLTRKGTMLRRFGLVSRGAVAFVLACFETKTCLFF
jgi:hypothetical protein